MIDNVVNVALTNLPATRGAEPIVRDIRVGNRLVCRSLVSISLDDILTKKKPMAKNAQLSDDEQDEKKHTDDEPEGDGGDDKDKPVKRLRRRRWRRRRRQRMGPRGH